MSQPSPDVKAVVRAAEALTTQVRRIADALTTPAVQYEVATDDDAPTPATTCSAQHHGHASGARDCIRAAQHHGDHIDEQGYHWSDTVAVYPTDSTVRVAHWHPVAEQLAEERQELSGMVGAFVDAQVQQARADEQTLRWARRESLLVLLSRLQRGRPVTEAEADTLRQHIETEMREADTARDEARRLGLMVDEYSAGARRLSDTLRTEKARADAAIERETVAEQAAEEIERDRDQHAAVLTDALGRFTHNGAGGYQCLLSVPSHVFEGWQAVVAPTVERPWWEQVREAQAAIERVRALADQWDNALAPARSQYSGPVRAALDGIEQPTRGNRLCHVTDPGTLRECALRHQHNGPHQDGDLEWAAEQPTTEGH